MLRTSDSTTLSARSKKTHWYDITITSPQNTLMCVHMYVHSSTQTNEENEDCFGVIVATRRLAAFYKIVDLSSYKITTELKELLEAGVSGDCCEGILENVIVCLRLQIMWGVHAVQETTTPNRVSELDMDSIFGKGRHTCLLIFNCSAQGGIW